MKSDRSDRPRRTCQRLLLAISVFFLFSCGVKTTNEPRAIILGERGSFTLLDPKYLEAPLDAAQNISGSYGKNQFSVTAWVKADSSGISMIFMGSMGVSLGEFEFDGVSISLVSPYLPKNTRAEYLAADFQLCYYQVEALQKALDGLTLRIEIKPEAQGTEIRRIYEGENLIIEIEKMVNSITYTNILRNYSYTITGEAE
jgi:hypothetical protein